ncbi:MAG: type III pantothenate kinase [Deltaproteobacteria bacterium]|nr:type III pantothenate kinase [Deltaproteobacteria bacterium]
MLATIDIGNTNIVIGVFDGLRVAARFRIATRQSSTADEYALLLDGLFQMEGLAFDRIDGVCMASVVPPLTEVFQRLAERRFHGPVVNVGPGVKTGISVCYEPPRDVGADRIVNAVAAWERHRTDLVIVDFGTATTFDAVTAKGEYLGGVIVPGVTVSLEALFQRTAKLPKVEMARPPAVIGRTTVHSIQSGAYWGYLAMVEGIVARMKTELHDPVRVVATGGLAPAICGDCPLVDEVDPDLTLTGLRLIWEKNR